MKKYLLLLLTLGWVVFACEKDDPKSIAQLTTTGVTEITQTTAVAGGNVTHDGGASVTARGVCWSTGQSPTINDSKTSNGSGVGSFSSSITGLEPNTTYFVRAYATNSEGASYGKAISFTTLKAIESPIITTTEESDISEITETSVVFAGKIPDDGGATITARGVCWSTKETPTIDDNKTEDGTGVGGFTSTITGLIPNTTYYVRVYATNNKGTSYGNAVAITTLKAVETPTIATTEEADISEVTETSAVFAGKIPDDGGAAITARGVCWSTNKTPTIDDKKTEDGTGVGAFTSTITGLIPNTTYYVRVYATNSKGTSYGNAISFTTKQDFATITDIEGNVYRIVTIGTQTWMAENLKTTKFNDDTDITHVADSEAWGKTTAPAYCWYNNNKEEFDEDYGVLYNWYTVNRGKLCPEGWHVPSDAEWTILADEMGGEWVAGSKLKETGYAYWLSPNSAATNEVGFSARAGGLRLKDGRYLWFKHSGNWWSTDEYGYLFSEAKCRQIHYYSATTCPLKSDERDKETGMSIRCVRD